MITNYACLNLLCTSGHPGIRNSGRILSELLQPCGPHCDMTARTGVDVVKAAYDAFRAGDVAGIAALCTPDTHWTLYGDLPWAGTHKGPAAVQRDYFEKLVSYARSDGTVDVKAWAN